MPLAHYLNAIRFCLLKSETAEAAIGELVDLLCETRPNLNASTVLEAVLVREHDVGTNISSWLAVPHARLPDFGHPQITVGLCRQGLAWGASSECSVQLVVLLIGDEADRHDFLSVLAMLARTLQHRTIPPSLLSAENGEELYRALLQCASSDEDGVDSDGQAASEAVYESACSMAEKTGAGCLLVIADQPSGLDFAANHPAPCQTLLVTNPRHQINSPDLPFDHLFEIPLHGILPRHALDFALLLLISRNRLTLDDTIVCLYGSSGAARLDTIRLLNAGEDLRVPLTLREELVSGIIDFQVLLRIFTLASELAHEGREGKPIGTLFVVGDYEQVQHQCHQMVINPFKGYSDHEKNILDPSLAETIKEFAHIDGAFVIRGDGVIMSAGSFIRAEVMGEQLQGGLGARHTAGQAITACTNALSLVLSESTGTLTLYKNGSSMLSLKRGS
ncbi:diadenylate cyclase [Pontiella agarivorans]|uniref:Diadenylate cyclase n=1 Tax=Pontiella agarivorans TaxID=3038953 RepID=A0ABU5MWF2_9BACT|nr:diadenylate cyclase [Pontiella agarivorans]MDZ8118535.1 diadenylate cyclase [Pontiella agarivorans]